MSEGWIKVALLTTLFVAGLAALNLALWRRLTAARATRARWTAADFDAALSHGDPRIAPVLRTLLAPRYGVGAVPHPSDGLAGFLRMSSTDVAALVAEAWQVLAPGHEAPAAVPRLRDVAALARFLDVRLGTDLTGTERPRAVV